MHDITRNKLFGRDADDVVVSDDLALFGEHVLDGRHYAGGGPVLEHGKSGLDEEDGEEDDSKSLSLEC